LPPVQPSVPAPLAGCRVLQLALRI
jgi:hypothetical protein